MHLHCVQSVINSHSKDIENHSRSRYIGRNKCLAYSIQIVIFLTMVMKLLLPCLLGLVVEVWGQQYPPSTPAPQPPYPSMQPPPAYEPHHQPGYAPAGYATPAPATGYGASGGNWNDLMSDPTTMLLLMQQQKAGE